MRGARRPAGSALVLALATLLEPGCRASDPAGPPVFREARLAAGGRSPFGVAVADLNGDGLPDLAVSTAGDDAVSVLLAAGGGFALAGTVPAGRLPRGLAAADLDGDGHTDLAVAGGLSHDVSVLLGDGRGGFARAAYPAGIAPFAVAAADLDGDGDLDLAVANETNAGPAEGRGETSLLFNDGRGRFGGTLTLVAGTHPAEVRCADLDGDGRPEVAMVAWGSRDVTVFAGAERGAFAPRTTLALGGAPVYALALGDLDGDGRLDVATADLGGLVRTFRNAGNVVFEPAETAAAGAGTRSLAIADLNADGLADLATADTAADTVSVIPGRRPRGFAAAVHVPVGKQPRTIVASDVNGDGRPDLVVTNAGSDDLSVLINSGLAEAE